MIIIDKFKFFKKNYIYFFKYSVSLNYKDEEFYELLLGLVCFAEHGSVKVNEAGLIKTT